MDHCMNLGALCFVKQNTHTTGWVNNQSLWGISKDENQKKIQREWERDKWKERVREREREKERERQQEITEDKWRVGRSRGREKAR